MKRVWAHEGEGLQIFSVQFEHLQTVVFTPKLRPIGIPFLSFSKQLLEGSMPEAGEVWGFAIEGDDFRVISATRIFDLGQKVRAREEILDRASVESAAK